MSQFAYLLNYVESRACRLNGITEASSLPKKAQLRQSFADHVIYSNDQLPPKVDLRANMTPIEDQSRLGSCVANTLAGAYEYIIKKTSGENIDVSRLFIYYNARAQNNEGGQLSDSGCSMTDGVETLEHYGVCHESMWSYDIDKVNTKPSRKCYKAAENCKITEAFQVEIDLYQMKACLAQGFPFAFGLKLFTSFDSASKTGVVPMPDGYEQSRQSHGSHALLAVGYSDNSNAFIVRNSWGQNWGENGYCYIPYDYMTNPNLCFDVWTVRHIESDDFGQDSWDNEDAVNLHPVDENNSYQNEESQPVIQYFQNEDELFNNIKSFAGQMLNTFISLAF